MKPEQLASYFDHTLLSPAATADDIRRLCREAMDHGFFSVCVNPARVALASQTLRDSAVRVCSVVGFPLGASISSVKALETVRAVADGADEIDMVIGIGALKEGAEEQVAGDIAGVVEAAGGRIVKVILETCLLSEEEKIRGCRLAERAGAHFVKTSTGFGGGGATVADVSLMRRSIGDSMQMKGSGGIRTLVDALRLIEAGADRLGASASVAILRELQEGV